MILTTQKLIQVLNLAVIVPSFLRDRYFSNVQTFEEDEINVEVTSNGKQVAPWVHQEVGGKVLERSGRNLKTYKAPETSPERVITRKNLLAADAQSPVFGAKTPAQRKAELIAKDLKELDDAITRLEEKSVSEILFTGKLTVKGDGYDEVINFWPTQAAARPYKALTGAELWTADDTADPISDLENAITEIQTRSGYTPTEALMSPATWALARKNPRVLELLDNKGIDVGAVDFNSKAGANGARLVGRLAGLDIYTYNQSLSEKNPNGTVTTTQLVPDGLVLVGSPNVPTMMAYGVVQIENIQKQDIEFYSMRRVPYMYLSQKKPAGLMVQIKSAPLPVPMVVDGFFVIKVTA